MNNTSIVYDEVTNVEVLDVENIRFPFKKGSKHVMRPNPKVKAGVVLGLDSYGRKWIKTGVE
jgi:hypothetical protein